MYQHYYGAQEAVSRKEFEELKRSLEATNKEVTQLRQELEETKETLSLLNQIVYDLGSRNK